jgi:pyruvate dehydrogenase E1 component alpha subunit
MRLAREDNQPVLVELITYRFRGHSMSDPAKYRDKDEVETWRRSGSAGADDAGAAAAARDLDEELEAIDAKR